MGIIDQRFKSMRQCFLSRAEGKDRHSFQSDNQKERNAQSVSFDFKNYLEMRRLRVGFIAGAERADVNHRLLYDSPPSPSRL